MFLDGSNNCTPTMTSCCIPWLVKTVPEKKDIEKHTDEELSAMPVFKRRRLELAQEERKAKEVSPTHEVTWIPFEIKVSMEGGLVKTLKYTRPVLKNLPSGEALLGVRCYRKPLAFDEETLRKKERIVKATGFILL